METLNSIFWLVLPPQTLGVFGSGVGPWALLPAHWRCHPPRGSCPFCCSRSPVKCCVRVQRPVCYSPRPADGAIPPETLCETLSHGKSHYYSYCSCYFNNFHLRNQCVIFFYFFIFKETTSCAGCPGQSHLRSSTWPMGGQVNLSLFAKIRDTRGL